MYVFFFFSTGHASSTTKRTAFGVNFVHHRPRMGDGNGMGRDIPHKSAINTHVMFARCLDSLPFCF